MLKTCPVVSDKTHVAVPFPIATELDLRRARTGDRDAVGVLWQIYQPQVLRFLRARGSNQPEDVASQVWGDVGRSLARFEGDGRAFQRWIFTIARRRSIDAHRSEKRHRTLQLPTDDLAGGPSDIDGGDSLDQAIELLQGIPTKTAEVIMLRVVYEMPVNEVADITGQSEANVRVLVHRGLKRLRDSMTTVEREIVRNAS